MKLEIIREDEFNSPTWYILKVDDRTVACSKEFDEIESLYDKIKEDPNSFKNSKVVLKSEQIDVSL